MQTFWRICGTVGLAVALAQTRPAHVTRVFRAPGRPADLVASHILPDPVRTPGAIYVDIELADVAQPGLSDQTRDVSDSVKRAIFRRDRLDPDTIRAGQYEIDHLVPLCLGGSNDPANLWAESFQTQPINAHTKDRLESAMLRLVRDGKITLARAQREMAGDWTAAYRRHVGPLPTTRTAAPTVPHRDN